MSHYFLFHSIKSYTYWLCVMSSIYIYAQDQEDKSNSISISLGYQSGVLKDANFSPLNYKQNGSTYTMEYIKFGGHKNSILSIQLNAGFNTLSTDASTYFDTDITQVQLNIYYTKRLNPTVSKSAIYLGGQLISEVKSLDWENTESFSYFAAHGIGLKGIYQYNVSNTIAMGASIYSPFIALIARPPYNGIDEDVIENQDNILAIITNGTIESLNTYFKLETEFNITYKLTESLAVKANIIFDYNTLYKGNKWTQFRTLTNIGLAYNF